MRTSISLIAAAALLPVASLRAQGPDSTWTIRGGTYAGDTVSIDSRAADRRSSRFWHHSQFRGQKRLVGWNPSRLPVAVAFRDDLNVSAGDSAAFWATLRQMEVDMGMRLFEPLALETGADPDDVIVIDLKPMASHDGVTLVTWTSQGSLYDARVFLRSTASLRNERVVTHEMMHALGFGHTTAWRSVMNPSLTFTSRLSREDVAYAQVAFANRAFAERVDLWDRLALALSREGDPRIESSQCDLVIPAFRSPEECTFVPCSVPSASCTEERNTGPLPER